MIDPAAALVMPTVKSKVVPAEAVRPAMAPCMSLARSGT